MSIRAGVVGPIPFQQVDAAPHAEAGAQGNHEGLQDFDCAIKKFHGDLLLKIKSLRPRYTPEISFFISCQPQRELIYWCILGPGVNKTPSQSRESGTTIYGSFTPNGPVLSPNLWCLLGETFLWRVGVHHIVHVRRFEFEPAVKKLSCRSRRSACNWGVGSGHTCWTEKAERPAAARYTCLRP